MGQTPDTDVEMPVIVPDAAPPAERDPFCLAKMGFDHLSLVNVPSEVVALIQRLVRTKSMVKTEDGTTMRFEKAETPATIGSVLCGVVSTFLSNGYEFIVSSRLSDTCPTSLIFRRLPDVSPAREAPPPRDCMAIVNDGGVLHFTNAPKGFVAEFQSELPALVKSKKLVCKLTSSDFERSVTTLNYKYFFDSDTFTQSDLAALWPHVIGKLEARGFVYLARWMVFGESCAIFVSDDRHDVKPVEVAARVTIRGTDKFVFGGSEQAVLSALVKTVYTSKPICHQVQKISPDDAGNTVMQLSGRPFLVLDDEAQNYHSRTKGPLPNTKLIASLYHPMQVAATTRGFSKALVLPWGRGQDDLLFVRDETQYSQTCVMMRFGSRLWLKEDTRCHNSANAAVVEWLTTSGYAYQKETPRCHLLFEYILKSWLFRNETESGLFVSQNPDGCHRVILSLISTMYRHGWKMHFSIHHRSGSGMVAAPLPDTWYFVKE